MQETGIASWRRELPTLTARLVTLREPTSEDLGPLVDLLSIEDAARFGIEERDRRGRRPALHRASRSRPRAGRRLHLRRAQCVASRPWPAWCRCARSIRRSKPRNGNARWRRRRGAPACSSKRHVWSCGVRVQRRSARTGSRRACCCRTAAPTARSGSSAPSRKASSAGRSRRRGEYVDQVLWSVLKDDWGDHWVADVAAGALMNQLPFRARAVRHGRHRRRGAAVLRAASARIRVDQPLLFSS